MGLYDYIVCEAELPEAPSAPTDTYFQTKDTPDQYMTVYTITRAGRLVWRPYDVEEVPKAERPYPNETGILAYAGSMRRVESEQEDTNFHGDIRFYHYDTDTREWWEYSARFTDGDLQTIKLVEYSRIEPPKPASADRASDPTP